MKDNFNIGDYVEPIESNFTNSDLEEFGVTFEDLYGFVTEKENKLITIQGISRGIETSWNEEKFRKGIIPNIFNEKSFIRTRK